MTNLEYKKSDYGSFDILKNKKVIGYIEKEANARHIVKFVNSHDELVEAVKTLLNEIDINNYKIDIGEYNLAKQALSKAGE